MIITNKTFSIKNFNNISNIIILNNKQQIRHKSDSTIENHNNNNNNYSRPSLNKLNNELKNYFDLKYKDKNNSNNNSNKNNDSSNNIVIDKQSSNSGSKFNKNNFNIKNNNNNNYTNKNNFNSNNKYNEIKKNNFKFSKKNEDNNNNNNNNLPIGNIEIKYLQNINKFNKESKFWEKFLKDLKEKPEELFKNRENHLYYLKYLSNITPGVQFLTYETWYKVRRLDFLKKNGEQFLKHYNGDHIEAIVSNFPHYNWKRFRFPTLPKNWWLKEENVREYIEWLVKTTNRDSNDKDEWHYIPKKDFIRLHGQYLVNEYQTVYNILKKYYPDYNWKPWLFERYPKDLFYQNREMIKKFIIWLGNDILKFKSWEDYYQLRLSDWKKNNGFKIIKEYNKSSYLIISDILKDEYSWIPWKFRIIPKKQINKEILIKYLDHLKTENNLKSDQELLEFEINNPDIIEKTNGSNIINEFGGSIKSALINYNNYNVEIDQDDSEDKDTEDLDFDDLYEIDNLDDLLENDHDNDEETDNSYQILNKKTRKINPLKLK